MPTAWNQEAAKNSAQAWLVPSWWLPRTQGYLPGHSPRLLGSANPDCHGSSTRLCKGSAVWKSSRLTIFLASRIKRFPSPARSQRQGEADFLILPGKGPQDTSDQVLPPDFAFFFLPSSLGQRSGPKLHPALLRLAPFLPPNPHACSSPILG